MPPLFERIYLARFSLELEGNLGCDGVHLVTCKCKVCSVAVENEVNEETGSLRSIENVDQVVLGRQGNHDVFDVAGKTQVVHGLELCTNYVGVTCSSNGEVEAGVTAGCKCHAGGDVNESCAGCAFDGKEFLDGGIELRQGNVPFLSR